MDTALRWGLPAGFAPVRYPISDEVKEVLRGVLSADEPVVVTLANEGDSVCIVATPQRLFTVKVGGAAAGVTGCTVKEFPWEAITDLRLLPVTVNVTISIHYKSSGGKVATGMRAKMGKDAADKVMPFESAAGNEVLEALNAIWHHKMMQLQQAELEG